MPSDVSELASAVADELERRRQLAGVLLVDVAAARAQLREVDDVLRRVERAIVSGAQNGADAAGRP